jgi:hypothetical protein
MAATCGPGAPMRSDVVACIRHLRAFATMLAGDRRRADDLVGNTIEQIFTAANWPPTWVDLKVQMFAVLHGLHYGALRPSTEEPAQQRESPLSKEDGLESDELLRIFGRLRDERSKAGSWRPGSRNRGLWLRRDWRQIGQPHIFLLDRGRDAGGFYELASSPSELETGQRPSRLSWGQVAT